jgi:NADP-dependent 3-hydroxy acid dehydrogenase YdfG
MTTQELAGRSAVVTGASSGIGRAIAERLGAAGAHVVLSGREAPTMEDSAARITVGGGSASVVVGDVRDPLVVASLIDAAVGARDRLDVFVNSAGVFYNSPILATDPDKWRLMLETNVLALLVGCQAAVRSMRATGTPGHIVNISSVAAHEPASGVYGATKHAVNVITNTLREELLDDPILLTTIMPGVVATNMARTLDPAVLEGFVAMSGVEHTIVPGERLPDMVIERAQAVLAEIMIRPEDVADVVLFALTRPPGVQVGEIVVRPKKDVDL